MPSPAVADDLARLMLDVLFWPVHFTKAWATFMRLTPETLAQPILPGWNLGSIYNITQENSAAPQTEHQIVGKYSYGRHMVSDIEKVRADEARKRFERMAKELSHLRKADPALYAEAVSKLRPELLGTE